MISDKIKEFRNSPDRTIISFKMTDIVSIGKKKDLISTGNSENCKNRASDENGTVQGSEKGDNLSGNCCKSDNCHNGGQDCENSFSEVLRNKSGSDKGGESCNCGKNNNCGATGSIRCSHSCNMLLCDIVAGVLIFKIAIKALFKCLK